jgi:hypothetical protein
MEITKNCLMQIATKILTDYNCNFVYSSPCMEFYRLTNSEIVEWILCRSTATRYGLQGPGIESRWGVRSSAPVQNDRGARPASYAMGTGTLSRGYSGWGVALTTQPHLATRLKKQYLVSQHRVDFFPKDGKTCCAFAGKKTDILLQTVVLAYVTCRM